MPFAFVSSRHWLTGTAALGLVVGSACASTPRGATEAQMALARQKAADGAALFEKECAGCHGQRGQGLSNGPAILGPRALPEYPDEAGSAGNPQLANPGQVRTQRLTQVPGAPSRAPFRTAADLHQYVSTRMPYPQRRSGSLKAEEYWAIVDFMLRAHGSDVPEGGVTPGNAQSVPLASP